MVMEIVNKIYLMNINCHNLISDWHQENANE